MYYPCPRCKSKNVKCIKTEVGKVTCKCLECSMVFENRPTHKLIDIFNE
jgi:uncharacterized Zn finger protein